MNKATLVYGLCFSFCLQALAYSICLEFLLWFPFVTTVTCKLSKPFFRLAGLIVLKIYLFLNVCQCLFCLYSYMCTNDFWCPTRSVDNLGSLELEQNMVVLHNMGVYTDSSAIATGTLNQKPLCTWFCSVINRNQNRTAFHFLWILFKSFNVIFRVMRY